MKKFLSFSFLLVILVFFCTACEGDVTRAIRHDGFNVGSDIVCDAFLGENATEKVRFLTSDRIVTTEGRIYELSLSQKYSNGTNCKVANTNIKVISIFDSSIVKASDGKYYLLSASSNGGAAYQQVSENDNAYAIYNLLLRSNEVVKAVTGDSSKGVFYVLKSDGNVYGITIVKDKASSVPSVVSSAIVFNQADYGGFIIDFNYNGESGATFVRTQNHVYRLVATNFDQCSKYADIACDYKMMEAPSFVNYGEYILAYNGSTIITTYGKTFTVAA